MRHCLIYTLESCLPTESYFTALFKILISELMRPTWLWNKLLTKIPATQRVMFFNVVLMMFKRFLPSKGFYLKHWNLIPNDQIRSDLFFFFFMRNIEFEIWDDFYYHYSHAFFLVFLINPLTARIFTVFGRLLKDRMLHKEAWVA